MSICTRVGTNGYQNAQQQRLTVLQQREDGSFGGGGVGGRGQVDALGLARG